MTKQIEIDEKRLNDFMKARQVKIGHPFNVFDYLEAMSDFYQLLDSHLDSIDDKTFIRNKAIAKQAFVCAMKTMREFGITEKDGYLVDYFKKED